MEADGFSVGRVVRSLAGRDKGNLFIVIERINNDYVRISDGKRRRVNNGKKKKFKHLKKTNHIAYELRENLEQNKLISDAQIRNYLKDLQE